jgi:hypothetical protein
MFGMFGEKAGYISADADSTSEKYNAMVDKEVKDILDVRNNLIIFFRLPLSALLPYYKRKSTNSESCPRISSTMTI